MTEKIKILVADDHPVVRHGLEVILSQQPDMDLLAIAHDGVEAVRLAQEHVPDVVIMDIKMPVMDGLAAINELAKLNMPSKILVLTSYPDDDNVFQAIKSGAMGYLLKDSTPENLLEAIRMVNQGESVLHPSIARKIIEEIKRPQELLPTEEPLTPRELEVLRYLAQGQSNREIAQTLTVSVRTITTHVRNILGKLHVANRTQAALYAIQTGILPSSDDVEL